MVIYMKKIYFIAAVLVFARSCIWEERSRCPTYFRVDFSQTPEDVDNAILMLGYDDGYIIVDTVRKHEFGTIYEKPIRREDFSFAVFGNVGDMQLLKDGVIVRDGQEAGDVYAYFNRFCGNEDIYEEIVSFVKYHTTLHIKVLTVPSDTSEISVTIACRDIGYDYTGKLLQGKYSYTPNPSHTPVEGQCYYEFETRILRQKQLDFVLSLRRTADGKEIDVYEIPLALKLKEAGIELDITDPDDIYIIVNSANMSVNVSVLSWDEIDNEEIIM